MNFDILYIISEIYYAIPDKLYKINDIIKNIYFCLYVEIKISD